MKELSVHTFENGGKERGFFCMELVAFLALEKEEKQLGEEQFVDMWNTRFNNAKSGACYYRERCSVYEKTLQKRNLMT